MMIEVKNLKKSFGNNQVLRGIDVEIHKGEVVVVIGPSGSGKSTFLRCLNLLEIPNEGSIVVEGENITDKKADVNKIRQKMGMVFQQFNLFSNMNIMRNMCVAPITVKRAEKSKAQERALELLRRVGLEEKADSYPQQLSGGQKQRVAIARALV